MSKYEDPTQLDYRYGGDTVDDFAQKYMKTVAYIFSALNELRSPTGGTLTQNPEAYQLKVDDNKLYIRNQANTDWILLGDVQENFGFRTSASDAFMHESDVADSGKAGKLIRADASGKLNADILGNAAKIADKAIQMGLDLADEDRLVYDKDTDTITNRPLQFKVDGDKIYARKDATTGWVLLGDLKQNLGFRSSTDDAFLTESDVADNGTAGKLIRADVNGKLNADILGNARKMAGKIFAPEALQDGQIPVYRASDGTWHAENKGTVGTGKNLMIMDGDKMLGEYNGDEMKAIDIQKSSLTQALAESTGYGIVSGCEPTISGLTVKVGAGVIHLSDGTRKELSATNITLDSADTTNPRIDLVYIDSTGTVAKITGTASASPNVPTVPTGGISVAQVSVAAGSTTGTITDKRDMLRRFYNTGIVNAKDFGAVGDGVHDDTAAFKAAILAANGKELYIPKGTYNLTEILFTDNVKYVQDFGDYLDLKPVFPTPKKYVNGLDYIEIVKAYEYPPNMSNTQAICYDSKRNHLLVGMKTDADTGVTAAQKIVVIDENDYSIVNTFSYTQLGHIGSLSYDEDDDVVYATAQNSDNSGTYVLSPVDGSVIKFISDNDLPILAGISYDKGLKSFVAFTFGSTTSSWRYAVYDKEYQHVTDVIIPTPYDHVTGNAFACLNGHIIQCSFWGLEEFDLLGNTYNAINTNIMSELEQPCYAANGTVYVVGNIPGGYCVYKINDYTTKRNLSSIKSKIITSWVKDFNNILDSGVYNISSNDYDNGPINEDGSNRYGFLEVFSDVGLQLNTYGFVFQRFIQNSPNRNYIFTRYRLKNVWSEWQGENNSLLIYNTQYNVSLMGITGYITSSGTDIYAQVALGMAVDKNINSGQINITQNITAIRNNGNYIYRRGETSVGTINSVEVFKIVNNRTILLLCIKGAFDNVHNNDTVALEGDLTISVTA